MSMVGNIQTAKQELDNIVEMGQTISFQGNAIVEELASTLASKEIDPETLQNLPGTLQRKIEEARKQIIPTKDHGSIQIYSDRRVFDSIHNAALLRSLID